MEDLKKVIREVPDFPKEGILFYDITTLLKDRQAFTRVIDAMEPAHPPGPTPPSADFARRRQDPGVDSPTPLRWR